MTKVLGPLGYCAVVLWLHGESNSRIAKALKWTRNKTHGVIMRHLERPRGEIPIEERQAMLDELKASRIDEGRLRDKHFVARKTPDQYQKPVAAEPEVDPYAGLDLNTRAGRREARRIKRELEKKAEEKRKADERRSMGHAPRRGRTLGTKEKTTSSALEYLHDHRLLKDRGTDKEKAQDGFLPEETRRLEAGLRFRAILQGARTSSLGAIDYERATMGAGSGPKLSLAAFKLHCIQELGSLRRMLPQAEYVIIEAVVDHDDFIWESEEAGSKERGDIYESMRYLLDVICVHQGLMSRDDFTGRWDETLPIVGRASRSDAADLADRAAEFMEATR